MKNLTKLGGEQIRHMSTRRQSDLSGGNLISRFHTFPVLHFTPIFHDLTHVPPATVFHKMEQSKWLDIY